MREPVRNKYFYLLIIINCLAVLSGCATLQNSGPLLPAWKHVKESAVDAALAPGTWVPLTGAIALRAGGWDRELSNWASTHNPVFGSRNRAESFSNYFSIGAYAANTVTSLTMPGDMPFKNRAFNKIRLLAVRYIAGEVINNIPGFPNEIKYKIRPDFSSIAAFPYGHIPSTAIHIVRASRNIDYLPISNKVKNPLHIGFTALALADIWARVEANKRSASGALAEFALGNFIGSFINNAFFNKRNGISLYVNPIGKVFLIGFTWYF